MTATYYERFYPRDMDGIVAYVAPNDVVNNEDSATTASSRRSAPRSAATAWTPLQREALVRRAGWRRSTTRRGRAGGYTFNTSAASTRPTRPSCSTTSWASGSTACCRTAPTVPAHDRLDRRHLRLRRRRSPASLPTPTRAWSRTSRTTTRRAPSSAGRRPASSTCTALLRYRAPTSRAQLRAARHPDEVRARRHARRRPLGPRPRAATCCSSTARTTRGAPSAFRVGQGARDSTVYVAPGQNHGSHRRDPPGRAEGGGDGRPAPLGRRPRVPAGEDAGRTPGHRGPGPGSAPAPVSTSNDRRPSPGSTGRGPSSYPDHVPIYETLVSHYEQAVVDPHCRTARDDRRMCVPVRSALSDPGAEGGQRPVTP